MKKNKKKMAQLTKYTADRFFSIVSVEDIVDLDDTSAVDIEMLRVGTFKHKAYGELKITAEMLEAMVKNFNDEVIGREVSFDWNHKAEEASGWLKDLKVEDGKLIGTTELTDKGIGSISAKEYGYFSIEYSDNYVDAETGDEYGPTILGGALTNRPFMTKLKKIEFSSKDDDVSLYRFGKSETQQDDDDDDEEDKSMEVKDKKVVVEEPIVRTPVKKVEDDEGVKKAEADKDDKKLMEFIDEQKKEMKTMKDSIVALQEENKALRNDSDASKGHARKMEVQVICEKLLRDDHHHPAVVAIAKELMLNDGGAKLVKLTEKSGDKEVQVEYTLTKVVEKLLEAIPASQRANYTEKTTTSSEKEVTEEDQKKMEDRAIDRAKAKKGLKLAVKNG
jgi:hypothetical protein